MPTYVYSVPAKSLSDEQKHQISVAIAQRHSEATGAPTFFVQVLIEESETARRYLGGSHIWVRGDIRAGRSEAVRSTLMLAIIKDLSAITGVPDASIWVYLCTSCPRTWLSSATYFRHRGRNRRGLRLCPKTCRSTSRALARSARRFGYNRPRGTVPMQV